MRGAKASRKAFRQSAGCSLASSWLLAVRLLLPFLLRRSPSARSFSLSLLDVGMLHHFTASLTACEGRPAWVLERREAGWGPPPESSSAAIGVGRKDTCEPANSTEVSARCPRRATTVFFPSPNTTTSASRGRQSDRRMCTRPAHAHTLRGRSWGALARRPPLLARGSTGRGSFFLGVGLTLFLFLGSCLMLPALRFAFVLAHLVG